MERCSWVGSDKIYLDYHDKEWGIPEYDSRALWEKLILDGFQAGLSWITILKKRDAFRLAFAGFEPGIIAQWGTKGVDLLLKNVKIVRHRGKIEATIGNAKAFNRLETEMPLSDRIWGHVEGVPIDNGYSSRSQVPIKSVLSLKISNDLRGFGFKFCGPTIVYAWMEACGLVNNHLTTCHRYQPVRNMAKYLRN